MNRGAPAYSVEVRCGMKMKGRYWRPECAVTSRLSKFLPLLPLSLCLETLSVGFCTVLSLCCITQLLSLITKPASLMLVFMLGRQAWYKSEVVLFSFFFFSLAVIVSV